MKRFKRNWSWLSLQSENVRDKEGMFCVEMKSKGCVCGGVSDAACVSALFIYHTAA